MSTPTRDEIVQAVRDGWPEHGSSYYPARGRSEGVPPVRDGGMTARLIDFAVDTALALSQPVERPVEAPEETIV